MVARRAVLQQLALLAGSFALSACGAAATSVVVPEPSLPPLHLSPLSDLVTGAGLCWAIWGRPNDFTRLAPLNEPIASLLPEPRRALFAHATAIDINKIRNIVVASYPDSTLFLLDGVPSPIETERLYRERLMSGVTRTVHRADAILLRGVTASGEKRSLAALGKDVIALESGSGLHTKVAALYAEEKLKRTPRVRDLPDIAMLLARLGDAPLVAVAPGPFEGDWADAVHGVLGACTAAAACARPTPTGTILTQVLFAGRWGAQTEGALARISAAWQDLARSDFGKLTGLDRSVEAPRTMADDRVVGLEVALDGPRFFQGLHAAVSAEARDIMRL